MTHRKSPFDSTLIKFISCARTKMIGRRLTRLRMCLAIACQVRFARANRTLCLPPQQSRPTFSSGRRFRSSRSRIPARCIGIRVPSTLPAQVQRSSFQYLRSAKEWLGDGSDVLEISRPIPLCLGHLGLYRHPGEFRNRFRKRPAEVAVNHHKRCADHPLSLSAT